MYGLLVVEKIRPNHPLIVSVDSLAGYNEVQRYNTLHLYLFLFAGLIRGSTIKTMCQAHIK